MSPMPDRAPTDLSGKQCLVTGASAGIGAATAQALGAAGADLVLLARRTDRLAALAKTITAEHGVDVRVLGCDLTDKESVQNVGREDPAAFEDTHVLVNNAGLAAGRDPMHEADPEDWQLMVDTNVMGLLRMTRHVVPHMVARDAGHIVNLGSVAGRWVYPGGGVYCATKHAVRALSEGLRMDLLGKNIRVTNIEPGLVETEFSVVRLGDKEQADKVYEGLDPLVGADIADAIVWSVTRPPHVNIHEMVIYPTMQSHVDKVHRTQG